MTLSDSPLLNALRTERGTQVFFALLLLVGVGVPALHALTPIDSALNVSTYTMTLIGKYMTYALLAIAVDLVWGYCGILSLGHAAFFALGGY
ncbi:MAG: urea ABC transporter permease subunit UrtC, partial [Steroidobacteraceae bacterium]